MEAVTVEHLKLASEPLDEDTVITDPIAQFQVWFEQAGEVGLFQRNAMTLATATAGGRPSARMVLLSEFDERGFVFHTSFDSRKARELAENPRAALVFWWGPLFRQVRIEGTVSKLARSEIEAYFNNESREHQIAAWAWQQSQVVDGRQTLEQLAQSLRARYGRDPIPTPPSFGGYRLQPDIIEFWQARLDWIHDWLRYGREEDGSWSIERLAP